MRAHHKNRAQMENEGAHGGPSVHARPQTPCAPSFCEGTHESGGIPEGAHGGNGHHGVVDDDLTIPKDLDRRHELACAQCGRPGGTEWKYDGVKVRLHSYCEQPWIESYEAELSKASQPNNDGHCDGVTLSRRGISKAPANGVPEQRCDHCGRIGGDLQEICYGEASAILHRDCQDAWSAALDLDIRNQPFYRAFGHDSAVSGDEVAS
jgi:hypothetical protein